MATPHNHHKTADELVCQDLVELISAYVEGELDERWRARVDAHLAVCDGCQTYLDQMQVAIRLARQLTQRAALSPEERGRLLELFRQLPTPDSIGSAAQRL